MFRFLPYRLNNTGRSLQVVITSGNVWAYVMKVHFDALHLTSH